MPRLNLALTPLVIPANEVWVFVANKRDLDLCFAHDDKSFARHRALTFLARTP
jgi:hypothetical protein